jgi:hypothetical protein
MEMLYDTQQAYRTVIVGTPGVGKTQVAFQLSYSIKDSEDPILSDISVFWVSAASWQDFVQSYREIAGKLDLNPCDSYKELSQPFQLSDGGDTPLHASALDEHDSHNRGLWKL